MEKRLLAHLRGHQQAMNEMLGQLVSWESPSLDALAQQPILNFLANQFDSLDYKVRLIPSARTGGHLLARPLQRRRPHAQLLVGHCDTVWPRGTLASMPLKVEADRLMGPGSYDMKAGLVQIIFALRSLHELGRRPQLDPYVLINSDEEVGSFESAPMLHRLAPRMSRCFVTEPSLGSEGKLKTARKGVTSYTVTITGRSAHAGLDPENGASAILELAYLIQELHALNDVQRGVSVNVGLVQGGLRPNVVAPQSRAVIDVRVPTQAEGQRLEAAIRALRPRVAGVSWSVEAGKGRPPLEPNYWSPLFRAA